MTTIFSDDWFTLVEKAAAEAGDLNVPSPLDVAVINVTVTETTVGSDVDLTLKSGTFVKGHSDSASTKMTLSEELAKRIFVQNDKAAGLQAYMSGQLKVEGDMSNLMAIQAAEASPEQEAFIEEVTGFTD